MSDPLPELVAACRACRPRGRRLLVSLAGPPASGKSTLAERLADALGPSALAVPLDGFHLDDRVLDRRGLRARKGSPESFDAAGFLNAVSRLATDPEVVLPLFDRDREISIAGALVVGLDCKVAVVEGNYLLLDAEPWRGLAAFWDLSLYMDVPEAELRQRLLGRWANHGKPDAEAWIETNDMPNARRVKGQRLASDILIRADGSVSSQPR